MIGGRDPCRELLRAGQTVYHLLSGRRVSPNTLQLPLDELLLASQQLADLESNKTDLDMVPMPTRASDIPDHDVEGHAVLPGALMDELESSAKWPGGASLMINYRVKDLATVLASLHREGIDVGPKVEESEHGRFGWVTDPEGNRIELWEPPKVYRPSEQSMPME